MSNDDKAREYEVFGQELSLEELDAAAGGVDPDPDIRNCVQKHSRAIYGGNGFPNCSATVESGSWCSTNDACNNDAIVYWDVKKRGHGPWNGDSDCEKAWH